MNECDRSLTMNIKIQPQSEVIASDEVVRGQCPPYISIKKREKYLDIQRSIEARIADGADSDVGGDL